MKWFKHISSARRDPKIVALRIRDGREGVCRWWEIVEIIAEEMNETDLCEIKINGGFLSRELGFRSTIDGRSFVDRLATDGLLIVDLSSNDWLIKCPKLLELRDHRIKNRIHKSAPEQNRSRERIRTPIVPTGDFELFWKNYPSRNGTKAGKTKASKEYSKLNAQEKAKCILAIREQIVHFEKCKAAKVFIAEFPDPFRWLRDKKFNDEVDPTVLNAPGSVQSEWVKDWGAINLHIETNVESASVAGLSEKGSKVLKRLGGIQIIRSCQPSKLDELKIVFRNNHITMEDERKI